MRCPHCNELFNDNRGFAGFGQDAVGHWWVQPHLCPGCNRFSLEIVGTPANNDGKPSGAVIERFLYPNKPITRRAPVEVPHEFAKDYNEAAAILYLSPQSSAALARRMQEWRMDRMPVGGEERAPWER